MKIEELKDFPPNVNPFHYEHYLMGHYIGKNVIIMMSKFENENHDFIIVIDKTTGKRIRIELEKVEQ
jgi:hypothetical protein